MADPFSIGAGIVGILGLTIQVPQLILNFGLSWKDAPKDVKNFMLEVQGLQMTLSNMQTMLITNASFAEAFDCNDSALLSHMKAKDTTKDTIKEAFEECHIQLTELLRSLRAKEAGHKLGWERFKTTFLSKRIEAAIAQLGRQNTTLLNLIAIDMAVLTASTLNEVKQIRKEQQEWHTKTENEKILKWLSQLSFEKKHQDILSRLHPGTDQWLLELDQFKAWRNGQLDTPSNLWCRGIRE